MNYKLLTTAAAFSVSALTACAPTASLQKSDSGAECSKSKSAANGASCDAGTALGPPVVDISKPAPEPGVASTPSPRQP